MERSDERGFFYGEETDSAEPDVLISTTDDDDEEEDEDCDDDECDDKLFMSKLKLDDEDTNLSDDLQE